MATCCVAGSWYAQHIMNAGALQIDRLRTELSRIAGARIGRRIEYLASTTSTNDEAWLRIDSEDADGLVVLAEHQSGGRGRFGRTWHSPRGASLLCSVALVDSSGELAGGSLCLLTAVAACDAVTACTDVALTIRWPNDLLISGRKLGGILIESRRRRDGQQAYVVGIGINCLQHRGHLAPSLGESATSLELESAQAIDRTALAVALLRELDRRLGEPHELGAEHLRREWLARAEPMGRRVSLQHAGRLFSGTMIDVDPGALLVVRLDEGGIRPFDAATTTIVRENPMAKVP